jgi:hypothetical protein
MGVQRLGLEELRVDFEREELSYTVFNSCKTIGLETGIFEGSHRRDELLSNSVVEAESPMGSKEVSPSTN